MVEPGFLWLAKRRLDWLSAAAVAVLIALGAAAAWHWRRRASRRGRLRLQPVGTVSGLFIYPVKSCRGLAVRQAEVTDLGLRSGDLRDRCWLVIKEDGHTVTARQEPRLVLISVSSEDGCLILRAPDMEDLRIPVKLSSKNPVQNCRLFGFDVQGRDCGEEAAQWITAFLDTQPYRLVHFESNMFPRNSKDLLEPFRTSDKDAWDEIVIGSAEMKGAMACPRCILTTVDPDTGIMDRKEPLETLKGYRTCDPSEKHIYKSSPRFGWYFGIDKKGILQDYFLFRCWTVIKEGGYMLSAKEEPRLVLVSVTCEHGYLTLNAPEMKALRIPVELPRTNSVWNCRRFGIHAQGRDCGDEAAQWITSFLNSKPYRLVHYEPNMVTRKPRDFLPSFQPTDEVIYAEASPILLISEASLEDLNTRLEKKIAIANFRPNIFVTGCGPYDEDHWTDILIGTVELKGRMSCPRCLITTVDPDTGVMDRNEPLKTLKRFHPGENLSMWSLRIDTDLAALNRSINLTDYYNSQKCRLATLVLLMN
ncbi:mitochondrial amidoxime reducing component 2-like isoform X1 [Hemicordylus capensis]|uniref:mitochondrial amidoxime reducing component 2-like isoform X1 n=1 Tax=Hemicordylus capensis TaxID=884348 RepID=UPI002304C8E0|nr:mitochondrial amidoxime reducing component 2-like isoform X1 [Hemicordylus capensis]